VDSYTQSTQDWLERRFAQTDAEGIYIPHQPIYGFRQLPYDTGCLGEMYVRTWQILRTLAHLRFDSLLDVGAAEGYKAWLVRELLHKRVAVCDLSAQACLRAQEIFALTAQQADVHALPYADEAFDVVLCSETLEHVTDITQATAELLRVARKAVVITVPHEPEDLVAHNLEQHVDHGHIHHFALGSFAHWRQQGYEVHETRLVHPWLSIPRILIEAMPRVYHGGRFPKPVIDAYNACLPLLRQLLGRRAMAALLRLDQGLCQMNSGYQAMQVVIYKQPAADMQLPRSRRLSLSQMLTAQVPFHPLPARSPEAAALQA
jgi:SAM-dependent methyltransferase